MAAKAPGGVNGKRGVGEGAAADAAAAAGAGGDTPWQVLLALPTRELAVQVAREVVLLSGGLTTSVELLVDASVFHDLSKVTAPIVVGSAKVLERWVFMFRELPYVSVRVIAQGCGCYWRVDISTTGEDTSAGTEHHWVDLAEAFLNINLSRSVPSPSSRYWLGDNHHTCVR